jgi:erythronate-4-phosphate dehydrogenase
MQIIADENIPYVREAFAHLGEVRIVIGRHLKRQDLKQAEIVLVRSVTQVNENLLADTPVRFFLMLRIGFYYIVLLYFES